MAVPELSILKPANPSISNSDDYELFSLSHAQIYDPKTRKPANLLDAYADRPVTVEGRLVPPSRQQQQYRKLPNSTLCDAPKEDVLTRFWV
jgi:hypothetical protein